MEKTEEKTKKKRLKCSHCGRLNHNDKNCVILHPDKRPVSEKEKALDAKIAALETKFKTVASLGQVTESKVSPSAQAHTLDPEVYMFGASGEMAAAVATRAQTLVNPVVPTTAGPQGSVCARHSVLPYHIGQSIAIVIYSGRCRFCSPSRHVSFNT